jgi:acyl dehydratase
MPPLLIQDLQSLKEFVGREIGVTNWFRISQDRQWIHVDRARASKESPYGTTIAHGFLTLSLVSHFVKEVIRIESGVRLAVNYGLNRVRFPAAVRADRRIRARVVLIFLKELTDSLEAAYGVTLEVDGSEKPACVAEWIVRYYT